MASKLKELGDEFRKNNMVKNNLLYTPDKPYGATHPNAISDGDKKGKGTNDGGESVNTTNGGGSEDINGHEKIPGSGRKALIAKNEAKYGSKTGPNGYGPNKPYKHPDTSGQGGPVDIGI